MKTLTNKQQNAVKGGMNAVTAAAKKALEDQDNDGGTGGGSGSGRIEIQGIK